jgi:predicted permease
MHGGSISMRNSTLGLDLRFAVRSFSKDLTFLAAAVVSLALGIGLNTGIFIFLNAVFLRPFPVADPQRLQSMVSRDMNDIRFLPNSYTNYLDYRDQNDVFSGMAAFQAIEVSVAGRERPEPVVGQLVTGNYFDVKGVKASLGRTFRPEEDRTLGTHPVVVLSHALWERRFESDPGIVGKTVLLNKHAFTVIGVAAKGFKGTGKRTSFQLWIPMMMHRQVFPMSEHLYDRDWRLFRAVGRLKPGVSPERAESELKVIARRLELAHPKENGGQTVSLVPFMHEALGPNDRYLFVRAGIFLTVVVGLVLLGACANVANLLLARAAGRRQEIATRISLGAGRLRILRQLLTESMLLALVAGVLGLLVAYWSRNLLISFKNPFFSPESLDAPLDSRVLCYALFISLITGVIFGLAPALQTSSMRPASVLKGFGLSSAGRRMTLRNAILMIQVAISFISLVSAGWFLQSLYNAREKDPGFEAKKLLLLSFNLGSLGYTEADGRRFCDRLLFETTTVAGVRHVALAENRLLAGIVMARSVKIEGDTSDRPQPLTPTNSVSPEYFDTLGIPIIRGRAFTQQDRADTRGVAIINEAMAHQYWPNQDPIGRRFRFDENSGVLEVIGIARDAKFISLTQNPQPHIYLPLLQNYTPVMTLYVRTAGDEDGVREAVRAKVQSLDRQLPLEVTTASAIIDKSLWAPKMAAALLSIFGALALLLATIGIYSIVAFTVHQRGPEIGLRMALGAQRSDIFWLIVREGMTVVALGISLGSILILVVGGSIAGLLYEVSPADPGTLSLTILLLCVVAFCANLFPARRAALANPLTAINGQ